MLEERMNTDLIKLNDFYVELFFNFQHRYVG